MFFKHNEKSLILVGSIVWIQWPVVLLAICWSSTFVSTVYVPYAGMIKTIETVYF